MKPDDDSPEQQVRQIRKGQHGNLCDMR